jgi:hypothetical protein
LQSPRRAIVGVVWWGGVGIPIQSNAGVECCAPTSFFSTSDDDDDNATFSSLLRILSFVGLSMLQV